MYRNESNRPQRPVRTTQQHNNSERPSYIEGGRRSQNQQNKHMSQNQRYAETNKSNRQSYSNRPNERSEHGQTRQMSRGGGRPMAHERRQAEPKKKWAKLSIWVNDIAAKTEKSDFIQMPEGTGYEEYGFWHPSHIIKGSGEWLELHYHDGFRFKMMKYEREMSTEELVVVDQFIIGPDELEKAFARIA